MHSAYQSTRLASTHNLVSARAPSTQPTNNLVSARTPRIQRTITLVSPRPLANARPHLFSKPAPMSFTRSYQTILSAPASFIHFDHDSLGSNEFHSFQSRLCQLQRAPTIKTNSAPQPIKQSGDFTSIQLLNQPYGTTVGGLYIYSIFRSALWHNGMEVGFNSRAFWRGTPSISISNPS